MEKPESNSLVNHLEELGIDIRSSLGTKTARTFIRIIDEINE